jgi:predicted amidophosphoribosyltransferase
VDAAAVLRGVRDAMLDLLLPAICPRCAFAAGPGLCPTCLAELPFLVDPCPWCAAPRPDIAARCTACAGAGLPHLRRVVAVRPYAGGVAGLVRLAKAAARPAAVRALVDLLPALPDDAPASGVVVPVPPSRGRRPGPHLGTALARACARRHHLPLRRLLATTRLGAEQHRLTPAERRRNVVGLFRCTAPAPAYVVLVDDLVTTGVTASAAAAALRSAGARRVDLLCLARTPKDGEPVTHGQAADDVESPWVPGSETLH